MPRLAGQLVWFAGLWLAGVLTLTVMATAIRWLIR